MLIINLEMDVNQVLRQRRLKKKQAEKHRRQRIKHKHQLQQHTDHQEQPPQDAHQSQQRQFYQRVFAPEHPQKTVQRPQEQEHRPQETQVGALKEKKRGLIRKMKKEKTRKGQPLMRNYVKYALTQLQLKMGEEKRAEQQAREGCKRQQPSIGVRLDKDPLPARQGKRRKPTER